MHCEDVIFDVRRPIVLRGDDFEGSVFFEHGLDALEAIGALGIRRKSSEKDLVRRVVKK